MHKSVEVPAAQAGCYLVGIAGASCSGKSTLARSVAAALDPRSVIVIAMDDYYRDLSPLTPEEREGHNFDEPAAIDRDLLEHHLQALAEGVEIDKPAYQFETHCRAECTERVLPTQVVILEGLFALYWPTICSLLGTRIFIDADDSICLARRLGRDVRERGRSVEMVRQQYVNIARPMYELHVAPTRAYADIVVSGDACLDKSTAPIVQHVRENLEMRLEPRKLAVKAGDAPLAAG